MKMTFTKSQFEMPDGKYLAKFVGVTMREATGQLDQRGNPMPPGMTWDFEITEGDQTGKKCDKLTGRTPTPKSACGKFLAAISDTVLKDGMEVDLAPFYGKQYRVTIVENRISDNPAPVRVWDTSGTAARPAAGPPPRRNQPSGAQAVTIKSWSLDDGINDPTVKTEAEILDMVRAKSLDVTKATVWADGMLDWKPVGEAIPAVLSEAPF